METFPDYQNTKESAYVLRQNVFNLIKHGEMGQDVLNNLLPKGIPHQYEYDLWDYKLELPTLPDGRKPHEKERDVYNQNIAGIVKDVVSFYNTYGGYLVVGVRDTQRDIVGFSKRFDCEDLNKKVLAATKHRIDCSYTLRDFSIGSSTFKIGILLIPQRTDDVSPVQFRKDAPGTDTGYKAYLAGDIYFRQAHECKPAISSEDLSFLCWQGKRYIAGYSEIQSSFILNHNLGSRDPGFIYFVGREDYLQNLWRWLCDKSSPCKLLTGLGGVGKTTLAREFADQIVVSSALGFEQLIWLSAKRKFYTASLNQYRDTYRVDFSDVCSLLRAILLRSTYSEDEIDQDWDQSDLIEEVTFALSAMPACLIVDDIDSLEPEQQNEVFHTIIQITTRTSYVSVPSRALLTARLELGAAPGQLVRVRGLKPDEFYEYVKMTAKDMEIPWPYALDHKLMKQFHRVTDGSPTFATSILRLIRLGESLSKSLDRWEGSDGEEARRFAFKKELDNLSLSQIRTLYVACILGEASTVELQQITGSNTTLLEDDIGQLRNYHLLALGGDITQGGSKLIVPSSIRLMSGIIREYVNDPNRIEKACGALQKTVSIRDENVSTIIRRAASMWREKKNRTALDLIIAADERTPDNPDLKCLLGRGYLEVNPPELFKAEQSFKRAFELGCNKSELLGLWVEAKKQRGDWHGIIEITDLGPDPAIPSEKVFFQMIAYRQLADIAEKSNNLRTALKHYKKIIYEINLAFRQKRVRGRIKELNEILRLSFQRYISITNKLAVKPSDHLDVWRAAYYAYQSQVFLSEYLRLGIERLSSWWQAVEDRKGYNSQNARTLEEQLRRVDNILGTLQLPNMAFPELVAFIRRKKQELFKKLRGYKSRNL